MKFNQYLSRDLKYILLIISVYLLLHLLIGRVFSIPESIGFIFKSILPFLLGLLTPIILGKLFYIQNIKITKDKYLDPHEFESEFQNMLIHKKNIEKLIIVFDNLDRVSPKKALEVIRAVKTFLEPKEIEGLKLTYLIPCDLKTIQKSIKEETNSDKPIEFLKKFFNLTISIPKFHKQDLEKYTRGLLCQTQHSNLINNRTIAWLISEGFQDNPRQILQFINTLLSYILLIENSTDVNINTNYLKDNINCFTKFLILKYEYPKNSNELIQEGKKIFLDNTSDIKTDSFEILQYLRLSKFETNFPKVQDFIKVTSSNNIKDSQEFIESENLKDQKFEDLFNHIITRSKLQSLPNPNQAIFLDCILNLIQKNNFHPTKQLFNNFQKQLLNIDYPYRINVSNVKFLLTKITFPKNQSDIIGHILIKLFHLKPDLNIQENRAYFIPYVEKLLEYIYQNNFSFNYEEQNPKNFIIRNYVGELDFDLLFGDDKRKEFFISEGYAEKLIQNLEFQYLNEPNKINREFFNLGENVFYSNNIELLGNKLQEFVKKNLQYEFKIVSFLNNFIITFFTPKEYPKFSPLKLETLKSQIKFDSNEGSTLNKEIAIFFILISYISSFARDQGGNKLFQQKMHPQRVQRENIKFTDSEYSKLLKFKTKNPNFSIAKSYKDVHDFMLKKAESDFKFKVRYKLLLV